MAQVIDISLQKHALRVVDRILEERGLAFFLKRGGGLPFAIDDRRVTIAVEVAARQLEHTPARASRESCFALIRRRLIAQVAEAMINVGF